MEEEEEEVMNEWRDEQEAWKHLKPNFNHKGGVVSPKPGYKPTPDDIQAICYLIAEWDWGYEEKAK